MSGGETFLTRWSRLKQAAEAAASEEARPADTDAASASMDAQEPTVDLSSLPSLDSIVADTDLSGFVKPGVPTALRHAALRRAWATDPAIRDFRGLQENDWDFTRPDSVPGFGTFASQEEIEKLARGLFGSEAIESQVASQASGASVARADVPASTYTDIDKCQAEPARTEQAQTDGAANAKQDETQVQPVTVRRHGGALPK